MDTLRKIARATPRIVGSPAAFLCAILIVCAWIAWGVADSFSNTWLLWPSAIASVITFLIAFSLQYTQNRDTRAIQLKLDEILRATTGARDELMKVEELTDTELTRLEQEISGRREKLLGDDV